jgi:hypothetical protein
VYVQFLLNVSNRRGAVMQAASRHVLAAAALAATGAFVVAPFVPQVSQTAQPAKLPVRSMDVRLVDAGSVLNIPVNLFDDILNIPDNEVQGLDVLGNSLLFSGDWWVPNATNLWGTDPGDIGHYMGIIDTLIPIASISGLDQPEIDPTADADGTAGLAQQIALLAAAELPVSSSCDAETCYPMTPPEVITGSTAYDRDIGFFEAITGHASTATGEPFGLFSNWLQVPLSELTSGDFTFTPGDDSGLTDPSPDTGSDGGVSSALGFDGTTGVDGTGTGDYMPWAGDTFQLNLFGPFEDFYNSLLATPSTSGVDGTGIDIPSSTSVLDAFQNLTAGAIVAFDPYVAGSPACPATCDIPTDESQLALLQDVLAWDPTNTSLATYVSDFASNSESTATQDEVNAAVALLQTGEYNFSPTELAQVDTALGNINPELPALFTNAGILTDPGYEAYDTDVADGVTPPSTLDAVYGGYDPNLVSGDLVTLFDDSLTTPVDPTLSTDLETLATDLSFPGNPAALESLFGAAATDPGAASDATGGLSTDLSNLLASFGGTTGSDLLSQLSTELSSALAADLGSSLPSLLTSAF